MHNLQKHSCTTIFTACSKKNNFTYKGHHLLLIKLNPIKMKKTSFAFLSLICMMTFIQCNSSDSKTATNADSTAVPVSYTNLVTANWKIGVQMWTFKMFTFAEALDKVDSAGVKYIEAYWGQPLGAGVKDSFGISMSTDSRAKLKQMLQAKGISIVAMGVITPNTKDEWQKAFDPLLTPGARNYWKSHNFTEINDGAIDSIIEYAGKLPSPQCEIFIGHIAGAANHNGMKALSQREGGGHRDCP